MFHEPRRSSPTQFPQAVAARVKVWVDLPVPGAVRDLALRLGAAGPTPGADVVPLAERFFARRGVDRFVRFSRQDRGRAGDDRGGGIPIGGEALLVAKPEMHASPSTNSSKGVVFTTTPATPSLKPVFCRRSAASDQIRDVLGSGSCGSAETPIGPTSAWATATSSTVGKESAGEPVHLHREPVLTCEKGPPPPGRRAAANREGRKVGGRTGPPRRPGEDPAGGEPASRARARENCQVRPLWEAGATVRSLFFASAQQLRRTRSAKLQISGSCHDLTSTSEGSFPPSRPNPDCG